MSFDSAYKQVRKKLISGDCDLETARFMLTRYADKEVKAKEEEYVMQVELRLGYRVDRELDRMHQYEMATFGRLIKDNDEE